MVAGVVKVAVRGSQRLVLGLRAYARHRRQRGLVGGTLGAVQKAIAAGRISLIGSKIDPEVADIQWADKTDAAQQARGARGGHAPRDEPKAPPGGDREGYFATKERRERAEADLAELELRQRRGELVKKSDVERELFAVNRSLRDRLAGIPDRIAPMLASETDVTRCHAIVAAELRAALGEVAGSLAEAA